MGRREDGSLEKGKVTLAAALVRAMAIALSLVVGAGVTSCSFAYHSLSREETQGQWSETVDGHTVYVMLASDGTVSVTGIPVAALGDRDNADAPGGQLDWNDLTNLSGTWHYSEAHDREAAYVWTNLIDTETELAVPVDFDLQGERLLMYYGYIEYDNHLTFTRTADQPVQPEQELLPRQTFFGTWVGGTADHQATIEFAADGTMTFTNLPVDLVRSDGTAEIDWDRVISFSASWSWTEDPITADSYIGVNLHPRPSEAEFDWMVMGVSADGSDITLHLRTGQVVWDRHLDFHRSPEQTK